MQIDQKSKCKNKTLQVVKEKKMKKKKKNWCILLQSPSEDILTMI